MFGRGGNVLGIGLAVYLRDEFSAKANRIRSSMADLAKDQDKLLRKNLNTLDQLGSGMLLASGGYFYFLSKAVKEAAQFTNHMAQIEAVTEGNTESMALLERQVQKVGTTGVFSINEIAKAAAELGKAGYSIKDINNTLQAASDLGAVGDISPELAADALGRVLNMYDLKAEASDKIANQIALAANKSAISVSELLESLKYSGDVARNLNIPFEETLGVFMRLGNAGLRGSMAGTSYANMLRYVAKASTEFATGRQSQAMGMLGMTEADFVKADGNLKGVRDLMASFSQHLQGIDPVKATAIMEAITGVRGGRALEPLLKVMENRGSLDSFIELLKTNPNYLTQAADKRMNNLWGDIERLKDGWTLFMAEFGEQPGIRMAIQGVSKLIGLITGFLKTNVGKTFSFMLTAGMLVVGVVGLMSKGAAFLGRMVMNTGVSFKTMGQSAAWAWNQATASAMRYRAAAGGVGPGQRFNAAGSVIDSKTGRIITPASQVNSLGGMGFFGGVASPSKGPTGNRFNAAGSIIGPNGRIITPASRVSGMAYLDRALGFGRVGGAMSKFTNMLTFASKGLFTLIGPIMAIFDLVQGKIGSGIGGLLGGVAGFFMGGPMGAMMGSMMGSGIGSMFDTNDADDLVNQAYPKQNKTTFSDIGQTKAKPRQTIIINVDGKKAISKDINNYNDELFNAYDY